MATLEDLHDAFDWLTQRETPSVADLPPASRSDRRALKAAREWRGPLCAAVVVAVVTVATVVVVQRVTTSDRPVTAAANSVPLVSPSTASPMASSGLHDKIVRLIADIPVLPGAVQSATDPTGALAALKTPSVEPGTTAVWRWWTAPGSVAAALAYFRSHAPTGMRVDAESKALPLLYVSGLGYGEVTATPAALQVGLNVVALGDGVAVQAEASAVVPGIRSTAEQLPADPGAALVTINDVIGAPAATSQTLSPTAASTLAKVLNSLSVFPPGIFNCPDDFGKFDIITFGRAAATQIVFRVDTRGCGDVAVSVGGKNQPTLIGGGRVDAELLTLLGRTGG